MSDGGLGMGMNAVVEVLVQVLRLAHIGFFAVGIGVAVFLEALILRDVARPITRARTEFLTQGHVLITWAVKGLWITGLAMIIGAIGFLGVELSGKLFTKLAVVTILTANMLVIDWHVVPTLVSLRGKALTDLPPNEIGRLGAIGGLSAACWGLAVLIGGMPVVAQLPPEIAISAVLGTLVCAPIVGGYWARWLVMHANRIVLPAE